MVCTRKRVGVHLWRDKLAGNNAPTGMTSSGLASARVANASSAQIAAAGIRCTFQMQATAARLAAAATNFAENENDSASLLRALDTPKVG
jgi:hypothetical protein